ncbi:MAG: DMT family transporter [Acidobacteria bacterium]|nr:DMT family transporter [Acidobacteriota bacterium]
MTVQLRASLALALIALIWGSTFVLVKRALEDCSVFLFLGLRFSIAAIALALTFRGRLRGSGRDYFAGFLTGLSLSAGYILQTVGLKSTTASKSGFLTGVYIVLVPLLAACVYRVVPGWREWLGIAMAATGMTLMTVDWDTISNWGGGTAGLALHQGDLLTLAGAVAFAVHLVMVGHYAGRVSVPVLSFTQIATSALVPLALLPALETPSVRWTPELLAVLAVTGLLATALVFVLQTWAQCHLSPARTALILALEPVFALVFGFAVAGERLTAVAGLGAGLILGGIVRVEMKPSREPAHPSI